MPQALQLCDGLLGGVYPSPPGQKQLPGRSESLTYLAKRNLLKILLFINLFVIPDIL